MESLSTANIAVSDFEEFKRRLIFVSSVVMGTVASIAHVAYRLFGDALDGAIPSKTYMLLLSCAAAALAAQRNKTVLASYIFFAGNSLALAAVFVASGSNNLGNAVAGLCLLIMLAGFISGPRFSLGLGLFDIALAISLPIIGLARGLPFEPGHLGPELGVLVLFTTTVYLVAQNINALRNSLALRLRDIEGVAPKLAETGIRLAAGAREIHVMADQQRDGANRQADSVTETREAMESILGASREIARAAQDVFQNAERTSANNERVVEQVTQLADQALRVGEMAAGINEIAGKSELLALNAALEGVKAGEAGEGFQLVAARMQELSESIGSLAQIIKAQVGSIRESNEETRESAKEAVELARKTTEAGRSISIVSIAQETSTEQVVSALEDISRVINQLALGTEQTMDSTYSLLELADEIPALIEALGVSTASEEDLEAGIASVD